MKKNSEAKPYVFIGAVLWLVLLIYASVTGVDRTEWLCLVIMLNMFILKLAD